MAVFFKKKVKSVIAIGPKINLIHEFIQAMSNHFRSNFIDHELRRSTVTVSDGYDFKFFLGTPLHAIHVFGVFFNHETESGLSF